MTAIVSGGRLAGEPIQEVPAPRRAETAPPGPPASPTGGGWRRGYPRLLLVGDATAATVAAFAGLLLRFGAEATAGYLLAAALFPPLWVAAIAASRGYEDRFLGAGSEEYRRVFLGGLQFFAVVTAVAYAARLEVARGFVLSAFPLAMVLTTLVRSTARRELRRGRQAGRWQHRVVAVGTERSVAEMIRKTAQHPEAGLVVVGACVDGLMGSAVEGVPVLGSERDAAHVIGGIGADTVAVSAWTRMGPEQLRRLSWSLEGTGTDLVVAPALADIAGPRIHIRPVAGLPLLHVEEPEFGGMRRIAKATVDRLGSALLLLLLAPLLVMIAVAVRLDSRGSPLFRQTRVGTGGSTFTVFKFRSMYADAEARLADLQAQNERSEGLLFKIREDPRVTRFGRILRRTSLDELPQLFNVLAGRMSLVGPRPPLPQEVLGYEADVHRRLLVKPGMTGLWQVSGRSDLTWAESVQLDLHYVENWSLFLDLQIMVKTVAAVLSNRGAY